MAERDRHHHTETIGQSIARLRRSSGTSGAELARRAGMSRQSLSCIERGIKIPRVRTLLPILSALLGPSIVTDITIPGRRIRALRHLYLLSGPEFVRLVGASGKDQLCEWETGKIVPNLAVLRRISLTFGLRLNFFFCTDGARVLMKKQQQRVVAMEKIGERVRQLCTERGLSLAEAERRAGLGRNRLYPIVSGRKKPRGRTLLRIAKVLGIGPLTFDRARISAEVDHRDLFGSAL